MKRSIKFLQILSINYLCNLIDYKNMNLRNKSEIVANCHDCFLMRLSSKMTANSLNFVTIERFAVRGVFRTHNKSLKCL